MLRRYEPNRPHAIVHTASASGSQQQDDTLNFVKEYKRAHPRTLFVISRSKNKNLVVYEVQKEHNKRDPIDVYWMDIDPEYVKKARARGKQHDREELNLLERGMAYGYTVKAAHDSEMSIALTALGQVKLDNISLMTVLVHEESAIAQVTLKDNRKINVDRFHVTSEETWFGPEVKKVEVYGVSSSDVTKPFHQVLYQK